MSDTLLQCETCGTAFNPTDDRGRRQRLRFCSYKCYWHSKRGPRGPAEHRFWLKVDRGPHPLGCWYWTAAADKHGYGRFSLSKGTWVLAHRFAWEQEHGPIPQGAHLLHSCDVPRCVNPAHLRPGSQADNMRDAVQRERMPHGGGHPFARLTDSDIEIIRYLTRVRLISQGDIALLFGVSQQTISDALAGRTWRHVV